MARILFTADKRIFMVFFFFSGVTSFASEDYSKKIECASKLFVLEENAADSMTVEIKAPADCSGNGKRAIATYRYTSSGVLIYSGDRYVVDSGLECEPLESGKWAPLEDAIFKGVKNLSLNYKEFVSQTLQRNFFYREFEKIRKEYVRYYGDCNKRYALKRKEMESCVTRVEQGEKEERARLLKKKNDLCSRSLNNIQQKRSQYVEALKVCADISELRDSALEEKKSILANKVSCEPSKDKEEDQVPTNSAKKSGPGQQEQSM